MYLTDGGGGMDDFDWKEVLLYIVIYLAIALSCYWLVGGDVPGFFRGATPVREELDRAAGYQRQAEQGIRDAEKSAEAQLTEAKKQSLALQGQLAGLKVTISEQGSSLQNANRLLKQYEEEEKYRQRKIKQQRNIAYVIAATAIFVAVRNASR